MADGGYRMRGEVGRVRSASMATARAAEEGGGMETFKKKTCDPEVKETNAPPLPVLSHLSESALYHITPAPRILPPLPSFIHPSIHPSFISPH